jgi:hypothetical protein
VVASGLLPPVLAGATASSSPKPLDYGFLLNGITFRFSQLDDKSELGVITDFSGAVGCADVQGKGIGTWPEEDSRTEELLFDSDMRFMKGHYIGVDGNEHRGTFAFV